MTFSIPHLLVLLLVSTSWVAPLCVIMNRIGRSWAWGLLAIFPVLGLVLLWVIALGQWPRKGAV